MPLPPRPEAEGEHARQTALRGRTGGQRQSPCKQTGSSPRKVKELAGVLWLRPPRVAGGASQPDKGGGRTNCNTCNQAPPFHTKNLPYNFILIIIYE